MARKSVIRQKRNFRVADGLHAQSTMKRSFGAGAEERRHITLSLERWHPRLDAIPRVEDSDREK